MKSTRDASDGIAASDQPAITHGGRTISYRQFCRLTHWLADRIGSLSPNKDFPVAIVMDRGFALYSSQFAVLETGGFFLPIDPANPTERIGFLLSDSGAGCVIADTANAERIKGLPLDIDVIQIDPQQCADNIPPDMMDTPISFPHGDEDNAYMIYTSGSTGKPKGVRIHWAAICNHNRWFRDEFRVGPDDRCLQIASVGFDISIEEIFTTLRSGACLVSIDKQALDSPAIFFQWMQDQRLTVLNLPTALWHNVVPALEKRELPESVRLMIIGGEQVNPGMVDLWFKYVTAHDRVRLVNAYGPTETTITATTCDLSKQVTSAIGRPIANLNCHIIDDSGQLVESSGDSGELFITGVGVAREYWNRPEQTARAFSRVDALGGQWAYRTGDLVRRDEDGLLHFLGRADRQVKLRGYRIELSEIEKAILNFPGITNAIVRLVDSGRQQLVCYAIPAAVGDSGEAPNITQSEIAESLGQQLPEYMIPGRFLFLNEYPTTVGGKIDEKRLESLCGHDEEDVAPVLDDLDQTQSTIVELWTAVLGSAPPSLDTTFEQCGGDSLAAMALAMRLEQAFPGTTFGVATLLTCPTVRQLAIRARAKSSQDTNDQSPIVSQLGQPINAHTPCLVFLHPGGGSAYVYNQLLDDNLRSKFSILMIDSPWLTGQMPDENHGETTQSIAQRYANALSGHLPPAAKILLAGYSFGGILAFEVARHLVAADFRVKQIVNIDQPVPQAISKGNMLNRIVNWLHRLKTPGLTWQELNYSREKKALEDGKKSSFSDPDKMKRSFQLEGIHAKIEDAYQPEFIDVEMHVIRGDVIEAKYVVADDYGWRDHVRRLAVHRVSGTHFTVFLGRNRDKLARKFRRLMSATFD